MALWDNEVINTMGLAAVFAGLQQRAHNISQMAQQQSVQDRAVADLARQLRQHVQVGDPDHVYTSPHDFGPVLERLRYAQMRAQYVPPATPRAETPEEKNLRLAREELEAYLRGEEPL